MSNGKMHPELKKKWLEALRSGEYKQGQGCLRKSTSEGDKFCCLGVLTDIVIKNNLAPLHWASRPEGHHVVEGGKLLTAMWLPSEVVILADISPLGAIPYGDHRHDTLANWNDYGATFEKIAKIIEEYF
jgi:hypothetical protein